MPVITIRRTALLPMPVPPLIETPPDAQLWQHPAAVSAQTSKIALSPWILLLPITDRLSCSAVQEARK
jgi:hypothetical protein